MLVQIGDHGPGYLTKTLADLLRYVSIVQDFEQNICRHAEVDVLSQDRHEDVSMHVNSMFP